MRVILWQKKYKAMIYNDLWDLGIALFMVISLSGCGADAISGKQPIPDDLSATDSSEILPEMPSETKDVVRILKTIPLNQYPMLPSSNILENLSSVDSLTAFSAMLKKSDMVKKLNGTGPYTVFAPSDVAFETKYGQTLKELLKPENKERLQQLVSTHLIAGKLTVADLQDGATLITAGGQHLKVAKKGGEVRINDAVVAMQDADCRNGIVHVVDKVLEPAKK